jgi:hypothetical protein
LNNLTLKIKETGECRSQEHSLIFQSIALFTACPRPVKPVRSLEIGLVQHTKDDEFEPQLDLRGEWGGVFYL